MSMDRHDLVPPGLPGIAAALAEFTDAELRALILAVNTVPPFASGLSAWLEHAGDWELCRRAGVDFQLQRPEAAIDPDDEAASLAAAAMLRERFARDAPAVAALFAAIIGELGATATRH
jgi:hypothetical protein